MDNLAAKPALFMVMFFSKEKAGHGSFHAGI
jgi:hypothetical protein